MPKIRWTIVTIHGGSLVLWSVCHHTHPPYGFYTGTLFTIYSGHLHCTPKVTWQVSLGSWVCIVELSSVSTTCGLYYDYLKPLTPSIHNGESFFVCVASPIALKPSSQVHTPWQSDTSANRGVFICFSKISIIFQLDKSFFYKFWTCSIISVTSSGFKKPITSFVTGVL